MIKEASPWYHPACMNKIVDNTGECCVYNIISIYLLSCNSIVVKCLINFRDMLKNC